jgi:protein-S-isoprenylcysteine O-methyltransferase Ste14
MDAMQICKELWSGFFVVWMIWALQTKRTQSREGISSRLPYSLFTIAAFVALFGNVLGGWFRIRLFPATRWVEILGVAITAAGMALAIWARAYLGGNWSGIVTVKVGHELVRTGPYRWVRHPIYSGIILALLGTALELGEWRGLLAVVLLYAGFKIKSRIEERTMAGVFGAEYDEYSRSTGAIFPRLPF